ncbi:hypothetical protein [Neorhizobium galegae]|uniref:hypothetical protein n=1 Tax=Neorhizobium galegae TaxID=399 RepID=UPI000620EC98|nr:hypothetical protein [Neorhizobium galegae]CDZ56637.1 Hypothetical protein NGAL_HAMBI2566_11880 [Neorhizobium galegae bv. orientalis]KAB1122715.1 hypothetical protein F4V90_18575 [Neorhizobium galegae]MCQ1570311.1 hypothetical protein [Neorhizobium galegae]MCQ1807848.1 hypothetical protein [Neorhizobium galegae]CDZ64292.1 Hypothetical protein NGAL_HAMBI2605_29090 [Neorhizobium galegae bv. orientalis]
MLDWSGEELSRDVSLLEKIRAARLSFSDRVCRASGLKNDKHLSQLRSEPTYLMAEFLYSMKVYGVRTAEDIGRFADLHNDYVVSLTKDPSKLQRLGLSMDRALASMFTADIKPRLLQNWSEREGAIDQSNLARFLVAVMSAETCRKVLIDFEAAGFVIRNRSPYGTVVICSTGAIEEIFGEMLRDLRSELQTIEFA